MIVCGWCARLTADRERCDVCGHEDPPRPFVQRGLPVPEHHPEPGRPPLSDAELRRRLASGGTDREVAERYEVDERTVRRWRQKVSA